MFSPQDQALTVSYAFVTNRVCEALESANVDRKLTPDQVEALKRGQGLLTEMLKGASIVVDGDTRLGYTPEAIPAASRALTVLHELSLVSNQAQIRTVLESFEHELGQIIELQRSNGTAPKAKLGQTRINLDRFFEFLSDSFTEDALAGSFGDDPGAVNWTDRHPVPLKP